MRTSSFPLRIGLGLAFAGVGTLTATPALGLTGRPVPPGAFSSSKWGVILRNTTGEPTAALRGGPYGRRGPSSLAATIPPPYGVGSLGILVGSVAEKIDFGNETIFAGLGRGSAPGARPRRQRSVKDRFHLVVRGWRIGQEGLHQQAAEGRRE
jgi:hypothetical protein